MGKLREIQINPVPVAIIAVLLAVVLGYVFIIRPGQVQRSVEKQWVTPEAAEARHDARPKNEKQEQVVEHLRAQERGNAPAGAFRRRSRD